MYSWCIVCVHRCIVCFEFTLPRFKKWKSPILQIFQLAQQSLSNISFVFKVHSNFSGQAWTLSHRKSISKQRRSAKRDLWQSFLDVKCSFLWNASRVPSSRLGAEMLFFCHVRLRNCDSNMELDRYELVLPACLFKIWKVWILTAGSTAVSCMHFFFLRPCLYAGSHLSIYEYSYELVRARTSRRHPSFGVVSGCSSTQVSLPPPRRAAVIFVMLINFAFSPRHRSFRRPSLPSSNLSLSWTPPPPLYLWDVLGGYLVYTKPPDLRTLQ